MSAPITATPQDQVNGRGRFGGAFIPARPCPSAALLPAPLRCADDLEMGGQFHRPADHDPQAQAVAGPVRLAPVARPRPLPPIEGQFDPLDIGVVDVLAARQVLGGDPGRARQRAIRRSSRRRSMTYSRQITKPNQPVSALPHTSS